MFSMFIMACYVYETLSPEVWGHLENLGGFYIFWTGKKQSLKNVKEIKWINIQDCAQFLGHG